MAELLAMYPQPDNLEHFDDYYWNNHIPLVKKMPGLQLLEVSNGPVQGSDGNSPYYLVARMTWESVEMMQSSLNSEEGKTASADVENFAPKGSIVLVFDTARA